MSPCSHHRARRFAGFGVAGLLAVLTLPAVAQGQTDEPWKFQAAIYGWFPAISGSSAYPVQGGGANIEVGMGDVLDALKFTFQGSFEARKGRWRLWSDVVYADLGARTARATARFRATRSRPT